MPLGTEVDLGPGYIVSDVDPAPPIRGTAAPSFRPMSMWTIATAELLLSYSANNWR